MSSRVLRLNLVSILSVAAVIGFGGLAACDGCGSDSEEAAEEAAEAPEKGEEDEASEEAAEADDAAEQPADKGGEKKAAGDKQAKGEKAEPATTRQKPAGDKAAPAKESGGAGAMSPEEKRREEREQRIAQLKRRNEERRKERLDRHAEKAKNEREIVGDRSAAARKNQPVLDVSRFLSVQDVRTLTGERTLTSMGHLKGIPTGESYNSAYFAPSVRANFGVSLQVWKERIRRDANQRYAQMRADFPNAEDTTALGGKSFISYFDDIISLTFADLTKRVIVSVSCSEKICTGDQLLSMANAVKEKL